MSFWMICVKADRGIESADSVVPSTSTMQAQIIQPLNGDPFVGMLETPVTSEGAVATFLANLPAYRTGVSPTLRGVEIGLAHGFLLAGPFIKVSTSQVGAVHAILALTGRGRGCAAPRMRLRRWRACSGMLVDLPP